jgi:carbon storage regulator
MLVLTRKINESIFINDSIVVTVLEATQNKVRIGISAPNDMTIRREGLAFRCNRDSRDENSPALIGLTAVCPGTI